MAAAVVVGATFETTMTRGSRAAALMFMSVVSGTGACGRDAPSPSATGESVKPSASSGGGVTPLSGVELAAASDAVVAYYAAVAAGDCPALAKLVEPAMSAVDCKQTHDDWIEHKMAFDRVVKSAPDGREPRVALVTVSLVMNGPREQLVRVKSVSGAWRLQP